MAVARHMDERGETQSTRAAWDQIARGYDRTVTGSHAGLAEMGLACAGLAAGMRFLDVAAGSGALSIPAARIGAQVLAVDQSPVMLELLTRRAAREGLTIETRVMDGHALEIDDGCFDLVGSQFGVMLFPDMPRGIREMARVAKPGGRVLMTVFGDQRRIEFFAFFVRALRSVRPEFTGPPPDQPPLPFQLQDPRRLHRELVDAGLNDVVIETTTETLKFASGTELWDWLLRSNPICEAVLGSLRIADDERRTIRQALEHMVRDRAGDTGVAKLTSPVSIGIGTK